MRQGKGSELLKPAFFLMLFLFSMLGTAQDHSSITVYDEEGVPFRIWVNGTVSDSGKASSRIRIDSLEAGEHRLEVRYPDSSITVPPERIRFEGQVSRTYALQKGKEGKRDWSLISEIKRSGGTTNGEAEKPIAERGAEGHELSVDSSFIRSYHGKSACSEPIDRERIERLLKESKEKTFESERMRLVKERIEGTCLISSQVAALMETLDYEDNRLELAKHAYERTFDQENYEKVSSALNFEVTRQELEEFLGRTER